MQESPQDHVTRLAELAKLVRAKKATELECKCNELFPKILRQVRESMENMVRICGETSFIVPLLNTEYSRTPSPLVLKYFELHEQLVRVGGCTLPSLEERLVATLPKTYGYV